VRIAALEAVAALAGPEAGARLVAALGDRSPSVRRRAVLLLGFVRGPTADEAIASALADHDAGVARAAALALSGRPTAEAQGALARALDHAQEGVRRTAAEAVARWAGEPVRAELPAEERRRAARRIAGKLAALDCAVLRDAVVASAPAAPFVAPASAPVRAAAPHAGDGRAASAVRAAVAVLEPEAAGGSPTEDAVLLEVRSALRGRTLNEIAGLVPGGAAALEALAAKGAVVRRGQRYFPA